MKFKGPISAALLIIISATFGASSQPENSMIGWERSGDHYEWLLESPMRGYLSGAAENYLSLRFAPDGLLPGDREESHSAIRGLNVRVNDRSHDVNPSLTTQSEAAIATFGSNVVVGWNDIGQLRTTGSLVGYGLSLDGGATFTDSTVVPPVQGGANLGDPDIAVDSDGNFYYSMIALGADGIAFIGVSKSIDGGRTFSPPVSASGNVSSADSFQDKEFIAADNTGGQYDGNVYASWTRFGPDGPQIMFSRSINGGRSFEDAIAVSSLGSFVQGSMPRVGPDGEIYVVYERFNSPGIHISKSIDGGKTFGTDGVAETLVANLEFIGQPASPETCDGRQILNGYVDAGFEFPSMEVNRTNGDVYVVFNSNPPGIDESDIHFVRSSDGGHTWTEPVRLNDDSTTSDQFMPAITVAPNGTIGAFWYDRRNDTRNLNFDVYMAISTDNGRTWLPNKRITTETSEIPPLGPNFDTLRPCYMGDYNDITADQNDFYLAWGDNRETGRTWRTLAPMPTERESTANTALGHGIFVIGGTNLGFGAKGESRVNELYNTKSDRWTSLAPMPTSRSFAAATSAGASVYVAGGQSSIHGGVSDAFERYDALLNRWVQLDPLPTPRMYLGAARVGSKLYFIGGQNCISPFCGETLNIVEVYDLKTGAWSSAASMPQPLGGFATAVIREKIYVVGGFTTEGRISINVGGHRAVWEFDPAIDRWQAIAALPTERISPIAAACGDDLIISGGINPQNNSLIRRDAWAFDTVTGDSQQVAAPKYDRSGIEAVSIGNTIYAIGGSSGSRVPERGVNEAFDCATFGAARPDPDIVVAKEPLPRVSSLSSSRETARPTFEHFVSNNHSLQTFRVNGLSTLSTVQVEIYNLSGIEIFDSGETDGPIVQWNLSTKKGGLAANGVYLYRIIARDQNGKLIRSEVRKILVLR